MSNALTSYLNKRMKNKNSLRKDNPRDAGPVITISREVGCNGLKLANLIANRLNSRDQDNKWQIVSKEIYHQSAEELNMKLKDVRRVFKQSERYAFNEILNAFNNKNYKSEKRIIKTVADVVRNSALEGYSIIVGRGGHIIAEDIKNAIHIRLIAPLEFRINTIQINNGLNREDSINFIKRVEKERIAFRKTIHKEYLKEDLFDLTINRASFNNDDIVDIIEFAIEKKGII